MNPRHARQGYAGLAPVVAGSLLFAMTGMARAEAAAADAPAQTVEVHGVKDPALLPYRKAYDIVTGVDAATGHRVQLLIRVTSSATEAPLPDLDIRLVGENTHARIPVSPSGVVDLPLDRGAYDDEADIVVNKPKKTLRLGITLLPRFAPGAIRYADVVEMLSAGKSAISRIVPWYLRMFSPSLHGIAICYPAAGQSVAIAGHEETPRAATVEDKDMLDATVFCARFSAKEAGLDNDSVLVPAEGWQALFW